jgi:hypothetical protein
MRPVLAESQVRRFVPIGIATLDRAAKELLRREIRILREPRRDACDERVSPRHGSACAPFPLIPSCVTALSGGRRFSGTIISHDRLGSLGRSAARPDLHFVTRPAECWFAIRVCFADGMRERVFFASAALAVLALGACRSKPLPGTADISVARSTSTDPAPETKGYAGHVVAYSRERGLVADGVVIAPPATTGGPAALVIPELRNALEQGSKERVVVALEGTSPYAMVWAITCTLGQSGISPFEYLVKNGERSVIVPVEAPRPCERCAFDDALASEGGADAAPPSHPLREADPVPLKEREGGCLHAEIDGDGVTVRVAGDVLGPSCVSFGRDATVPRLAGSVDRGEVVRCLRAATTAMSATRGRAEPRRALDGGEALELLARTPQRVLVSARKDTRGRHRVLRQPSSAAPARRSQTYERSWSRPSGLPGVKMVVPMLSDPLVEPERSAFRCVSRLSRARRRIP